jgi:hypothetical protein
MGKDTILGERVPFDEGLDGRVGRRCMAVSVVFGRRGRCGLERVYGSAYCSIHGRGEKDGKAVSA